MTGGGAEAEVLRFLGLALRARRLQVGTRSVKEAARKGELAGAVLAADAGENARGRVRPLLEATGVPVWELADRQRLGEALGRGPVVVAGITDPGFAEGVRSRVGPPSG